MNNKEFIAALSQKTKNTHDVTSKLIGNLCLAMTEIFEEGESITVSNFGSFETKKRTERIIVNPSSGQRMLVPPKVVLSFKPAQQIKGSVKKGGQA